MFDISLHELELYAPMCRANDFDAFWTETLAAAGVYEPLIAVEQVTTGLSQLDAWDVSFAGFDGQPIYA